MLESPAVVKEKTTKEAIFNIIGALVQRYNHGIGMLEPIFNLMTSNGFYIGAVTSIIHLLPHFEHLPGPFAQLVQLLVQAACRSLESYPI